MRNLVGLEMVCFGRTRHFELVYEGGSYLDDDGAPVEDLLDNTCYACAASYYTRDGDPIAFCPNCGDFERKRFAEHRDLVETMRGQDLAWLTRSGLTAVAVRTFEGDWRLRFARDPTGLLAAGKVAEVRSL